MILLDLIKLKLRTPSTALFMSGLGGVIGAAGAIAFLFAVPLPVPAPVVNWAGIVIWQLSEGRLRIFRREQR